MLECKVPGACQVTFVWLVTKDTEIEKKEESREWTRSCVRIDGTGSNSGWSLGLVTGQHLNHSGILAQARLRNDWRRTSIQQSVYNNIELRSNDCTGIPLLILALKG